MYKYLIPYLILVLLSKKIIYRRGTTKPYLTRFYLVPNNKYLNMYLHFFHSSDEDDALHDHPWNSLSIILYGKYIEHEPISYYDWIKNGNRSTKKMLKGAGSVIFRPPEHIHKIELLNDEKSGTPQTVVTLFMTGPYLREWGFWCNSGFRKSSEYLDLTGQHVGKGCD